MKSSKPETLHVKALLARRGMTQADLANEIGTSRSKVSRVIAGKLVCRPIRRKIEMFFGNVAIWHSREEINAANAASLRLGLDTMSSTVQDIRKSFSDLGIARLLRKSGVVLPSMNAARLSREELVSGLQKTTDLKKGRCK